MREREGERQGQRKSVKKREAGAVRLKREAECVCVVRPPRRRLSAADGWPVVCLLALEMPSQAGKPPPPPLLY